MIDWDNLKLRTRIYLLAMIGIAYEHVGHPNYEDAKKLNREYEIGLRSLPLDERAYFNPFDVMQPNPSDEEGVRCAHEANKIFEGLL